MSKMPRAIVAMSGGVDSSVTAALLHAEGYEVVGITLQLYDHGAAINKAKACCAGQDIQDAKRVAETIGFPHYTLDYESRFRQEVIDDFADTYLRGETPIPCVRCNQTVKFRDLLQTARDLGGDFLATGHYVQRLERSGRAELHRGADPAKDQSYFLFATTQEQLDFLRFPLGGKSKDETRALAAQFGLSVADKPDSQDICFVPTGHYSSLVQKLRPEAIQPGEIVHLDGRVLGQHDGIIQYTVGQRKGLGIGGGEVLYVIRLEPETRRVIVGPEAALACPQVRVRGLNWLGDAPLSADGTAVLARVRSTRPPVPAQVFTDGAGRARVVFEAPQQGVSPGQACVFYQGERVLGGGWIQRS
jgi:tRNA-specific 2-thiouridylase